MSEITTSRLRRGFGPVYRKISRCGAELSLNGKMVLLNLLEHLGQNSKAWPAQSTMATELNISEKSVWTAVKELGDKGFVIIDRRGQGKSNAYEMALDVLLDWAEHKSPSPVTVTEQEPYELRNKNRNSDESFYSEEIPNEGMHYSPPEKSSKVDWSRYPRSDESNDNRTPESLIERWLLKEMVGLFNEKLVAQYLAFDDRFYPWRMLKVKLDGGDKRPLKTLFPECVADFERELQQIRERDAAYRYASPA